MIASGASYRGVHHRRISAGQPSPVYEERISYRNNKTDAAVELFKLIHTPTLDAFRLTLPGTLLLGRIFSPWDLLAYYTAITLAAKFLPAPPPIGRKIQSAQSR